MPPRQNNNLSRDSNHAILLFQPVKSLDSRTYADHETVSDSMNHILSLFESSYSLGKKGTSYDTRDLFAFIDGIYDISILIMDKNKNAYIPYGREWIKNKLYMVLQREYLMEMTKPKQSVSQDNVETIPYASNAGRNSSTCGCKSSQRGICSYW